MSLYKYGATGLFMKRRLYFGYGLLFILTAAPLPWAG
jgi:hypothetical protein